MDPFIDVEERKDDLNLIDMPTLVCDNIVKYLNAKELLSLRRVSKTTKSWASNASRRVWNGYQLEIRPDFDGWQNFDAAVRSVLNVTEIFINNPGDEGMDIYKSSSLLTFMTVYGPHIRKLKVQSFGTFVCDAEFDFFESLTNLQELKLQVVDARKRASDSVEALPVRFPSCFRNLKVLKFGNIMSPFPSPFSTTYHWDMVNACPELEYLRFPVASSDYEFPFPATPQEMQEYYDPIMDYVNTQLDPPRRRLTLRTLDLKYVVGEEDMVMSMGFPILLLFLYNTVKDAIQIRNAHCDMVFPYSGQHGAVVSYMEVCNKLIQSMINLQPPVQLLTLPGMTKLVINSTSYSCVSYEVGRGGDNPPDWPNLKTVSILIDGEDTLHLPPVIKFLLKARSRPSVEKLAIVFDEDMKSEQYSALISGRIIARNFENLRSLELVRWNVKNVSFPRLWEGLGRLEELTVEDCTTFGNAALIGGNPSNPTFLRLKSLRKLRLKLDQMPLVTDRAFRDVFSKMRLKEFNLQAIDPLEKITEAGIQSLLDGEFGKSIEKFPFKNWSLASLSYLQFKDLGRQFRSIN